MLVDVNSALEELGLDKEDFDEFVDDLKAFLEEGMPALKGAIESEDFTEVRAQAHAIKGALANLRFVQSADVAKKLEEMGRTSTDNGMASSYAELEKSLADSYAELG